MSAHIGQCDDVCRAKGPTRRTPIVWGILQRFYGNIVISSAIMEKQMEKKLENAMETLFIEWFIEIRDSKN